MKTLVLVVALTFAFISNAKEESRVLATVTRNLKTAEKIQLIGFNLGSSDSRHEIIKTDKNGNVQTVDVTNFGRFINTLVSHLSNKDEVPVKELEANFICYMASPDATSTLYVERYSRKDSQGGFEKVLDMYGCQTPKRTHPINSGDFAVAEALLHFIKAAVNE